MEANGLSWDTLSLGCRSAASRVALCGIIIIVLRSRLTLSKWKFARSSNSIEARKKMKLNVTPALLSKGRSTTIPIEILAARKTIKSRLDTVFQKWTLTCICVSQCFSIYVAPLQEQLRNAQMCRATTLIKSYFPNESAPVLYCRCCITRDFLH